MINLQSQGGSLALVIASVWTGVIHLALGVLGTFVLKRFPTSFSVGFFFGILVVLANQNMLLMGTFQGYGHGNVKTNHVFANMGFVLFIILTFFATLLYHFKTNIVVAPIDAQANLGRLDSSRQSGGGNHGGDYQQYEDRT